MEMTVSVLIVNYNGLRFLRDCLDSIAVQLAGIPHEVIIVDNQSQDGSVAFLQQEYPHVKLEALQENLGFGKGNNRAAERATGKYLLLLNNDTILLDDLTGLVAQMETDPTIGVAGIRMLGGKRENLSSAGRFPQIPDFFRMSRIGDKHPDLLRHEFRKDRYEVDWLTGSFLLIPKTVYEAVGGFDPDFFMYVEDVDLCRRIHDRGYRIVYFPRYSYLHFVGFNKKKNLLLVKGWALYIEKHYSGYRKSLARLALGMNAAVKKTKLLLDKA